MAQHTRAKDWECTSIVSMGAAGGPAGGVLFWDFRSRSANTHACYLFLGGGLGFGGSMGGGVAPSPLDVIKNRMPDIYSPIKCLKEFSADDLDMTSGKVSFLGAAGAIGYSAMSISAGIMPALFDSQSASGWNTGVGINGAILSGLWKQLGDASPAFSEEVALDDTDFDDDASKYV